MAERTDSNANPYLALGVRPFINCCSVRTMHGGSLMLPRVRAAMDAASRQFVNLDELMEAAGQASGRADRCGMGHRDLRQRSRGGAWHPPRASPATIRCACCACRSPKAG